MEESKDSMRLNAVRRIDPHVSKVVDSAVGTALYKYAQDEESWAKTDVEGTLMIYMREAKPHYMITIINRLSKSNFIEALSTSCEMQVKPPYLLYKNAKGTIYCIWFPDVNDVERIAKSMQNKIDEKPEDQSIKKLLNDNAIAVMGNPGDDIMSLLTRAHGEFEHKGSGLSSLFSKTPHAKEVVKPSPLRAENNSTNPVADLFAKVSGTPHSSAEMSSANPILQKLFQTTTMPYAPQIVGSAPTTTAPIPIPNAQISGCVGSLSSSYNQQSFIELKELEGRFKENLSISHPKEDNPHFFKEEIAKPQLDCLLSPQVFTGSQSVPYDKPITPNMLTSVNRALNGSPQSINELSNMGITPLTQEQLVKALHVMLKDKKFVHQLHQAYIQSLQQSMKGTL